MPDMLKSWVLELKSICMNLENRVKDDIAKEFEDWNDWKRGLDL